MIVIADASSLRYLVLIDEVHILPQLFGILVVPAGVMSELSQPDTPVVVRRWVEPIPSWISVREPQSLLTDLPVQLGRGEREAIALAEELHADALLVDDGLRVPRQRGVVFRSRERCASSTLRRSMGLLAFRRRFADLKLRTFEPARG